MEAHTPDVGLPADRDEPIGDLRWLNRSCAVGVVAEHVGISDQGRLGSPRKIELPGSMPEQQSDGPFVERHVPPPAGFRTLLAQLRADLRQGAFDPDDAGVEVDVRPAQRSELTPASSPPAHCRFRRGPRASRSSVCWQPASAIPISSSSAATTPSPERPVTSSSPRWWKRKRPRPSAGAWPAKSISRAPIANGAAEDWDASAPTAPCWQSSGTPP